MRWCWKFLVLPSQKHEQDIQHFCGWMVCFDLALSFLVFYYFTKSRKRFGVIYGVLACNGAACNFDVGAHTHPCTHTRTHTRTHTHTHTLIGLSTCLRRPLRCCGKMFLQRCASHFLFLENPFNCKIVKWSSMDKFVIVPIEGWKIAF